MTRYIHMGDTTIEQNIYHPSHKRELWLFDQTVSKNANLLHVLGTYLYILSRILSNDSMYHALEIVKNIQHHIRVDLCIQQNNTI